MLALLEFAVMGGGNALKPRPWNDDVIVPSPAGAYEEVVGKASPGAGSTILQRPLPLPA